MNNNNNNNNNNDTPLQITSSAHEDQLNNNNNNNNNNNTLSESELLTKRGWLSKRGQKVTNWKRRYFVLKDGGLAYYEKEDDVYPKGTMSLFGAVVVSVAPKKVGKENCLEVSNPERNLYITCENRKDIKDWALAIQRSAVVASGRTLNLQSEQLRRGKAAAQVLEHNDEAEMSNAVVVAGSTAAVTSSALAISKSQSNQNNNVESYESSDEEGPAPITKRTAAAAAAATQSTTSLVNNTNNNTNNNGLKEDNKKSNNNFVDPFVEEQKLKEELRQDVNLSPAEKAAGKSKISKVFVQQQNQLEDKRKSIKALRKQGSKWNMKDVKLRKTLPGHKGAVNGLARYSNTLVSAGEDHGVRIWDTTKMIETGECKGHQSEVLCVACSKEYAASSSKDGSIRLWTLEAKDCVATLSTSTGLAASSMIISDNGQLLVTSSDNMIQVFDIKQRKCIYNEESGHDGCIASLAIFGQFLFSGSEDHTIKVWDLSSFKCIDTLEGHKNWVFSLAISYEREKLYSGGSQLKVWDISGLKKNKKVKCVATIDKPHDAPSVQNIALSEDERYMLTVSIDGLVNIWELDVKSKSKPKASLENRSKFIFGLECINRRIFTSDKGDGIKIWE